MSKFKEGDRVVRINSIATKNVPIYSAGWIKEVNSRALIVLFDCAKGERVTCYLENAELEHIFNSPLYQALR